MLKVAIIVLADRESHADLGRLTNAFETAKELQAAGDLVQSILDGAETRWIEVLADPAHRSHRLFQAVRGSVTGACRFCATAFGVREHIEAANIPLLGDFDGHPSLRTLMADGYQIITF